jgi:dTDP-4-amino-4,6-dideoxygalactose transaminase
VVHAGGTPVICDVEMETFALSLDAVKNALENIGTKVVGVILAPCYGLGST